MVTLEEMIANPAVRAQISKMLDSPRGIVAINGGNASGKTTCLFSMAEEVRRRGKKCRAILVDRELAAHFREQTSFEDADIRMISGTEDEWRKELAEAPDGAIVVAEELDYKNARLLFDAARKGACIFTQIHTPYVGIDAAYALQTLGLSTWEFLALFSCVATQMLVPRLCKACRVPVTIDIEEARRVDPGATEPMAAWKEIGCPECGQRGTKGRRALHEVLMIDEKSRPVLAEYLEKGDLKNPMPEGHVTMQETARLVMREGDLGLATYKHEISQNPILRMQHQWELERRRAGHIREMFSRFVTSQVVDRMLADAHVQSIIEGERRWVTCMFADIRGYTTMSESMAPTQLFRLLNDYFSEIIQIVSTHGGTIDKFLGDCVMVLFGAPVAQPDHEYLAVRCAQEVQRRVARLNASRTDGLAITMGIGINTGDAMTGCLGSAQRMDYTALGDTINTASRLEGKAQAGKILIGSATARAIEGRINCKPLGSLALKGKTEGLEAFEVDAS